MRYLERNSAVRPNLSNDAPDRLLRSNIWWMIVTAMHDGNSWLATQESVKNFFSGGGHSSHAQCFVHNRRNDRHRLSAADQRIAKSIGVHSHKVGAIYNNCTCGSMLNVQLDPHICR